jgi:hypothetical protein
LHRLVSDYGYEKEAQRGGGRKSREAKKIGGKCKKYLHPVLFKRK